MPISSTHLSTVNDHLSAAIGHLKEAQGIAVSLRSELHALALTEGRVIGLIDVVQWQTRISEALLTAKGIRDAPCLGASIGELVSPGRRGRDNAMDEQPIGSDFMVEPGGSVYAPSDGQGFAAFNELLKACGHQVVLSDQNPPDGMEA
jgi:hypothetical protein